MARTGFPRAASAALAVLLVAATATPTAAQDSGDEQQSNPQELAREGAERIMRAIEGILQFIPQYGMPRIQEDGDIVIPRLNPPQDEEKDAPDADGESTAPQTKI